MLWLLLGLLGVLLLGGILLFNALIRAKVRVREAWAKVAVQQQRRHDLLPALVATVSASADHERALLDAVTTARAQALAGQELQDRQDAEAELSRLLPSLLALAEQQPRLQSDASFRQLQQQLRETEDRLAFARDFATDRVGRYRRLTDTFPGVVVARLLRFPREAMFARESERVARPPTTSLQED